MKICAIIPVAPFEPIALIARSIDSLTALDCTDLDFRAYYVIDGNGTDYSSLTQLLPANFRLMIRSENRGRRAGAINDALSALEEADFVALFDVDSRPDKDFITRCVRALREDDAVLASGCRYITNKVNTLSKVIAIEYGFFCDIYRLFSLSKGFMQFNGIIGLSKADFLTQAIFDERASCEDVDMTQRIYLSGNHVTLAKTRVGEQAPTRVHDLYKQRVRWFRGALEGIQRYFVPIWGARISLVKKVTWFGSLIVPFFSYLLIPFVPRYLRCVRAESANLKELVMITCGLFGYTCFMTVCGAVAVGQHLIARNCEWGAVARSET
ncbi:MAG: glycosyltransferase family 2 protein [Halobacteriota archaeon]